MFSQLGVGPALCASIARLGYDTPTPVQTEAIPHVLSGVDLLARAQTGTGKTAAFGLPIIQRLLGRAPGAVRRTPLALILVPTRELAVQVEQALKSYAPSTPLRVTAIFGGAAMSRQIQTLQRGIDVVVATPGRLLDHLQRRTVDLSAIEVLVLDEADRMLDMGFLPPLRRVVAAVPRRRQTLLFSATLSDAIVGIASEFTRDPRRVDVSPRQVVAATVTHQVHDVAVDRKRDVMTHILTEHAGQALVFCKTKRGANRVGDDLGQRGVRAGVIHGNKSQNARTRVLDDFKAGRVHVLVATDIAARGLDIAHLPLVVNFDLPLVAEDYVHRIGRTGRAGQQGRAVSLVSGAETGLLREIQRVVTVPLERVALPGFTATSQPTARDHRGPGDRAAVKSRTAPFNRSIRDRHARDSRGPADTPGRSRAHARRSSVPRHAGLPAPAPRPGR